MHRLAHSIFTWKKALKRFGKIRIERFGWALCPGDEVMQTQNNYDTEVHNGDLGVVSRIELEEGGLAIDFDGRENYLRPWWSPTRRQSTRARAWNIRLCSYR